MEKQVILLFSIKIRVMNKPNILLTNDDGIRSPGLWAAAEELSKIGFVTVVAPRDQSSGAGRSLPQFSDGIIKEEEVAVRGQTWKVYSVGGSPAQAVQHGLLEIMQVKPDLVVSGINYGENVASGITISGTVGAAMEAASMGIPALASSQATDPEHHLSYSLDIDFSTAAHFTRMFAELLLKNNLPKDIDLLKLDIPNGATPQTKWEWTRLSPQRYYEPTKPVRDNWSQPGKVGYELCIDLDIEPKDSDVYAITIKKTVSVTPISMDLTARVPKDELNGFSRQTA